MKELPEDTFDMSDFYDESPTPDKISFAELQKVFDKFLLLEDRGIVRAVAGTFVGNQMKQDPIWLMIVGSSSGGNV